MKIRNMITLISLLLLTACATQPVEPVPTVEDKLNTMLTDGGLITEQTDRGLVVYLPALFFEYGAAELKGAAQDKIRFIADAVNQDYALNRRIAVEGHTDAIGDDDSNMQLSQERAESVVDELVFSKVATDRIEAAWFGEAQPLAPNTKADGSDNPDGRAKNRRVEFIILNPTN